MPHYRQTDSKLEAVIVEYNEPPRIEYNNKQVLLYSSFVNGLNAITIALAAQQIDAELEVAINQHYDKPETNSTNNTYSATAIAPALALALEATATATATTGINSRRANRDLFDYEHDLFEHNNEFFEDDDFFDISRAASDSDSKPTLRLPIYIAELGPSQLRGRESLLVVVGNIEELGNSRIRSGSKLSISCKSSYAETEDKYTYYGLRYKIPKPRRIRFPDYVLTYVYIVVYSARYGVVQMKNSGQKFFKDTNQVRKVPLKYSRGDRTNKLIQQMLGR